MLTARCNVFVCLFGCVVSFPVLAKKVVYSPRVNQGEIETAYYVDADRDAAGKVANTHELELEYGVSRRDRVSVSLIDGHRSGQVSEESWKLEWVHTLTDSDAAGGMGFYVEYRQARNAVDQVEVKYLYETAIPEQAVRVRLNAELERGFGGGADNGTEVGYAASVALTRDPDWVPALEAFGTLGKIGNIRSVDEQSHLAGAAMEIGLAEELKWKIGGLFGLTSGSEDWRVKSELSLEW